MEEEKEECDIYNCPKNSKLDWYVKPPIGIR